MLILTCPYCEIICDETELAPGGEAHLTRHGPGSTDDDFKAYLFTRKNPAGRKRDSGPFTAPTSKSSEGQWFCEAAVSPSNSSVVVARWLGSNRLPVPRFIRALGSSAPDAMTPRGRWYLNERPISIWSLASKALASVSPP